MITKIFFIGILCLLCQDVELRRKHSEGNVTSSEKSFNLTRNFRFDYEFSEQAEGWLKYHIIPSKWDAARLQCHAEGAVLASPLNEQLKGAILAFVKKQKNTDQYAIFSGVHATFSKGVYASIEGVPLLRLAITWAPGEPNNFKDSESCLMMLVNSHGVMADVRCDSVLPYVCYKKETRLTMTACGTTDPEYTLNPQTGSCYKFHSTGLAWSEAYKTCAAEGGHLVIIDNDVEAAVVTDIFKEYPENKLFASFHSSLSVGFHDWGHYGRSFMTIHGETLDNFYHKWTAKQPDNQTNVRSQDYGQYCGSVFRDGLLDDQYCNLPIAFLCEKDPNSLSPW